MDFNVSTLNILHPNQRVLRFYSSTHNRRIALHNKFPLPSPLLTHASPRRVYFLTLLSPLRARTNPLLTTMQPSESNSEVARHSTKIRVPNILHRNYYHLRERHEKAHDILSYTYQRNLWKHETLPRWTFPDNSHDSECHPQDRRNGRAFYRKSCSWPAHERHKSSVSALFRDFTSSLAGFYPKILYLRGVRLSRREETVIARK